QVARFIPDRLAESGQNLGVIDNPACMFAPVALHRGRERSLRVELRPADERPGEALLVQGVIPAVAAFDAQPAVVAGAVAAFGPEDAVILDVVGQGTADAAVG